MESVAVTIKILDKEYRIACPPHEREALLESAQYLNQKMREIRDRGSAIGSERVAVMAALNIAHELLQSKMEKGNHVQTIQSRIDELCTTIDVALAKS